MTEEDTAVDVLPATLPQQPARTLGRPVAWHTWSAVAVVPDLTTSGARDTLLPEVPENQRAADTTDIQPPTPPAAPGETAQGVQPVPLAEHRAVPPDEPAAAPDDTEQPALRAELARIFGAPPEGLVELPYAIAVLKTDPLDAHITLIEETDWYGESPAVLVVHNLTPADLHPLTAWARSAALLARPPHSEPDEFPPLSGLFLVLPARHLDAEVLQQLGPTLVRGMISDPAAIREFDLRQRHPAGSELAVLDASALPEKPPVAEYVAVDERLAAAVEALLAAPAAEERVAAPTVVRQDGAAWVLASALRHHQRSWWQRQEQEEKGGSEPIIEDVADEVHARLDVGKPPIPYMRKDATGGLADPARGGLPFGVELGFRLLGSEEEQIGAAGRIVQKLQARDLTRQDGTKGYHASHGKGYTWDRKGWVLERDGKFWELVSPKLWDVEWAWEDLETVLQIALEEGAVPDSGGGGGHVHVGTGQAGADVRVYQRMRNRIKAHHNLLVRWAANPLAESHRGIWRTAPLRPDSPAGGYRNIAHLRSHQQGVSRNIVMNISHNNVQGVASDHTEFRLWDASLDPAVVQVRVKHSLALVHAALRSADDPALQGLGYDRLGSRAGLIQPVRRPGKPSKPGQPGEPVVYWRDPPDVVQEVTGLLQRLYWRLEDRRQAMALHVITHWYGGLGARDLKGGDPGWVVPAEVPGLDPLQRLARIFVIKVPGGVVFTASLGSAEETDKATQMVADVRATLANERAFVAMLDVQSHDAQPAVVISGIQQDTSAEPTVELTGELLAALLPRLDHPDWRPGTPVALALNDGEHGADLWQAAQEIAEETAAAPGIGPVYLLQRGDADKIPAGVATIYTIYKMPGRGVATSLPQGPAWLQYGPPGDIVVQSPGPARTPDAGYLANPEAFNAVAAAVANRRARHEPPILYHIDGAAERPPFELTLEFEINSGRDGISPQRRLLDILHDLQQAGLTTQTELAPPETVRRWGATDAADGWLLIQVGPSRAELISPMMRDESPVQPDKPDTWRDLPTAYGVIIEHGGVAVGNFFSAGIGDDADGALRRSVGLLFEHHVDVLDRLAADPVETWRHGPWSTGPHFEADHVTFPPWSGSLDPAVLQARIRIWSALVAPRKLVGEADRIRWFPVEVVGGHGATERRVQDSVQFPGGQVGEVRPDEASVFAPGPPAETATARRLFSVLFDRLADRDQAAALFHITSWRGGRVLAPIAVDAGGAVHRLPGVDGVHAVPVADGAIFSPPQISLPPYLVSNAATHGDFVVTVWLGEQGPVAYDRHGSEVLIPGTVFAGLLAQIGWRSGMAVSVRLPIPPALWSGLPELISWTRDFRDALGAPVSWVANGAQLAQLAKEELTDLMFFALPDYQPVDADRLLEWPHEILVQFDPEHEASVPTGLAPQRPVETRRRPIEWPAHSFAGTVAGA